MVPAGGVFSPEQADALTERLRHAPGVEAQQEVAAGPQGPPPSRWSLRTIRVSLPWLRDYSLSGVGRLLARYGLKLRSARVQHWSPDPAYLDKQARLRDCLREAAQQPEEVVLLFLDEMGYTRWPDPALDWGPSAPHPAPVAQRAGGNNRQWRIVGALNALTGQVHSRDNYIVGREQLAQFYRQLDQAYPDVQRIYVAQDNWSVHSTPEVLGVLEQRPRLTPVWLPTYAPWLNPIEKLWRWLRQDVLKRHRLADDWPELQRRVRAFLDQFAEGSHQLLQYVGLRGDGKLATALLHP